MSQPHLFVSDQQVQELMEDWDTHEQMDELENKLNTMYSLLGGGFLLFGWFFFLFRVS